MLIDIHIHLCPANRAAAPDNMRVCTSDEMLEMLDAAGIDCAVVLPIVSPECAFPPVTSEEVMDMCRAHPDRFIPFANLDSRMFYNKPDADFSAFLEYVKESGFKGIGEYMPNIPFDDPRNMNVFHQIEESGLPLVFHVAPAVGGHYGCYDDVGLPRLEKVLAECPTLKMLGHSQPFWAEISADVTDENRNAYPEGKVTPGRVVDLMREYPNLYGDLSAGSGHNAISRDPEFGYAFLEEFQDRLFFGTDICRYKQETPIVPFFREIREKKLISDEAYEKITWRNANDLLRLGPA